MSNIAILLLAAGASKRMGHPKQLLPWRKQNILEHQVAILKQTGLTVYVILGANAEDIIKESDLSNTPVYINPEWSNGMGTTISFGITKIISDNDSCCGVLIALADQPLVAFSHYQKMISSFEPNHEQIIASRAKPGHLSVPVLFDKYYFEFLKHLNDDRGAMSVVQANQENIKSILCESSLQDIDTVRDYQKSLKEFTKKT